jgi:hypothetical protein
MLNHVQVLLQVVFERFMCINDFFLYQGYVFSVIDSINSAVEAPKKW